MTVISSQEPIRIRDSEIFAAHSGGKLSMGCTLPIDDPEALSVAYTPGVAKVSQAIAADPSLAARYTWAHRLVAIVTNGSAVLGLGNVGPAAALPVMEGKAALFKRFAGLNAIPLVLDSSDIEEIIEVLVRLRPSFGAVCLEDIAAPLCFELEARAKAALDCPVLHDDQHGTAVAVLAGLRGASTLLGRRLDASRIVVLGAGAAGSATAELLLAAGAEDVTVLDSQGILFDGRDELSPVKAALAARTNPRDLRGGPAEALRDADAVIGLCSATVPESLIATMAPEAIVFALSNPVPEIDPGLASRYAAVVGTGGSNFPNQIINTLASPGIFRGALDANARFITTEMKLAAADAIASVAEDTLAIDRIVPHSLDPRVPPAVADAVIRAAQQV
ncbi:NAD-dependent malic enzyme [Streptomyces sp. NBC_01799]|uniref:NAD(P)-dependent malic enzyme n=1 Tax=Streptomyces sp. NBC_01800 TaxID=2975945 RepID=UPI002DDA951D|nr:malic enzyme-like NAD(P)-binding protein [Streptomyces sp. NBC_01800]WSA71456.1 NAD-dependent malic enzyme [Streptomyces sp. NBC_01800]WSA79968.1 NAD-dependent malic enzyme [Streptomyces sp. NBC_01799]